MLIRWTHVVCPFVYFFFGSLVGLFVVKISYKSVTYRSLILFLTNNQLVPCLSTAMTVKHGRKEPK